MESNAKAAVELFHLLFLEQLSQKLDKRLYAVKGGCNLRFFLGGIRYSEDIDIDIQKVALHTLKNTIDKVLLNKPFEQVLKTKSINIVNFSAPKQTPITQRWKVQLITSTQSLPINTKIEFSRRNHLTEVSTEIISRELIVLYKIRPIFISHYTAEMALYQKIKALILRNETQARDIFDIYHLIQTHAIKPLQEFTQDELQIAIDNATGIKFSAFKSQVISYLEPIYQAQYDDTNIWEHIVSTVCENLKQYVP